MGKTCSDGELRNLFVFIEEHRFLLNEDRPSSAAARSWIICSTAFYLRDDLRPLLSDQGQEGFAC
ncbi:hypothetical protein DPMN_009522 [Dreissena polymorpha]|uniref:Uncharacterized protein n=1 Tax=Dreissena polymorpha TaxID=45954 RepID=A0A9D4S0N3_DREPO|nr:hypothetical protein DPMN_009522 [Dreissena polymorpha]